MRRFIAREEGTVAVLTIVLLPAILMVTAGVLELGRVRIVAERARIAADLATVAAVNDQDETELARTGVLRAAADAERVAREHLALNLAPLAAALGATPEAIATDAEVVVFPQGGAIDARTGRTYAGPTVRVTADLPVVTPVFATLLARPITLVRLISASSAR